jgi:general secretion pathway protein A
MILNEFELPSKKIDKATALDELDQFLIQRYAEKRQVLLIIDEAQNLSGEALEEIRMLSNLHSDDQPLLQIMIVGQPELVDKLKRPELRQFAQRIAVSYHLTSLDREETGEYIAYRLQKAGGRPDLFTPHAVDIIFKLSEGIPRSINLACEAALVYGFADEATRISQNIVKQFIRDKIGVGLGNNSDEKDELVARLHQLLLEERKRNAELVRRYSRLEMKYQSLMRCRSRPSWRRNWLRRRVKSIPGPGPVVS